LIYSDDYGRTWYSQDGTTPVYWESKEERNSHNMVFWREPNNSFSLLTALQMGKNYEHNTDGYIYVYAPNGDGVETMRQLVMFRVPKEPKTAILERTNYEYFVALRSDGTADWSGDIDDRGAVYTFPGGWVNTSPTPYAWHPSVVYDAPLRVYVMVTWGNGCSPNGVYFDRPSYLGFWIAEHPWGPWRQIHEEVSWMPEGDPALPRLRAGSMNLLRDTGRRKKCCRLVSSELSWTVAMTVTRCSPRLRIMTATSSIWRASLFTGGQPSEASYASCVPTAT
jgi:hypothetical protein